jgi:hypothetical protein
MDDNFDEFNIRLPSPTRGMTSIEAMEFLKAQCPDSPQWLCWIPSGDCAIPCIVSPESFDRGEIKDWSWSREAIGYPSTLYHAEQRRKTARERNWTGLLRVRSPKGKEFLLFSFLDSEGSVGRRYFISPPCPDLVSEFNKVAMGHFTEMSKHHVKVTVTNGKDLLVDLWRDERVFMPSEMHEDIERQVEAFYTKPEAFSRLGVPYRRGLLFVGAPGCGKTMMVRRIIRQVHGMGVTCWTIKSDMRTDTDDLENLMDQASLHSPSLVILEELDSLVTESRIPRGALLSCLDGLESVNGMLIIGTTNNPTEVDPALMHRPSRFDRVWLFKPPAFDMRVRFLGHLFNGLAEEMVGELAYKTDGWSYAYLNEMKVSAALLALGVGMTDPEEDQIRKAHGLLADQFGSGRKNHAEVVGAHGAVGFG